MQHVYILSNPAFQHDIRKVGYTSVCVIERAKALSSDTGVPLPFAVDFSLEVEHGFAVEQIAHKLLRSKRINRNREFFKVTRVEAITAIVKANNSITPELVAHYERLRVERAESFTVPEVVAVKPRPKLKRQPKSKRPNRRTVIGEVAPLKLVKSDKPVRILPGNNIAKKVKKRKVKKVRNYLTDKHIEKLIMSGHITTEKALKKILRKRTSGVSSASYAMARNNIYK